MALPLFLPPRETGPANWPGMELYAATILLEAEAEPDEGKLGVAWVIRQRMDARRQDLHEIILSRLQFSCWNDDFSGSRRARLIAPDPEVWARCWWAACAAYWRLLRDPTHGADHYLNPVLTRASRLDRGLPSWYDPALVTATIGAHEFLRLG